MVLHECNHLPYRKVNHCSTHESKHNNNQIHDTLLNIVQNLHIDWRICLYFSQHDNILLLIVKPMMCMNNYWQRRTSCLLGVLSIHQSATGPYLEPWRTMDTVEPLHDWDPNWITTWTDASYTWNMDKLELSKANILHTLHSYCHCSTHSSYSYDLITLLHTSKLQHPQSKQHVAHLGVVNRCEQSMISSVCGPYQVKWKLVCVLTWCQDLASCADNNKRQNWSLYPLRMPGG